MNADKKIDDPSSLRILEDMVRITNDLDEHELTNIGPDALFDRVFPTKYSGRVRGAGWGVSNTSTSGLSEVEKLKRKYENLEREVKEMRANGYWMMPSGSSSHMDNFNVDDDMGGHDNELDNEDVHLPEGPVPCYLYLDKPRRNVGKGILHNGPNEILHGVPLPKGWVRVQFEVAVETEFESQIPQPTDEVKLMGTAPGHFLSWPKKLVSLNLEPPLLPSKKTKVTLGVEKIMLEKRNDKTMESIVSTSHNPLGYQMPGDSPHDVSILQLLRVICNTPDLSNIEVPMDSYFYGEPWAEQIFPKNVLEVLNDQWLSASSIAFYIRYLGEAYLSKNKDLATKYSCMSPHFTSKVDSVVANNLLADCLLKYDKKDHLVFVPHNVGEHWLLIAINNKNQDIYFLDPARNSKIANYKDLKMFIESAMRSFRSRRVTNSSKTAFNSFKWTNIQCPKQIDGIHCGHYIGCFIEDILRIGVTTIPPLPLFHRREILKRSPRSPKVDPFFTFRFLPCSRYPNSRKCVHFVREQPLQCYPQNMMKKFKVNWAGYLYNRFLKDKMSK